MISFAPSITLKDGSTYTPQGWMWILAFALRGFDWAIKQAREPAFEVAVEEWRRQMRIEYAQDEKASLEQQKLEIEAQIANLASLLERLTEGHTDG